MAVAAECTQCADDAPSHPTPNPNPTSGQDQQQPFPNLGVVLGVLGGCSLVALLVAIVVPLARRRVYRKGARAASILSWRRATGREAAYSKVRDRDVELRGADAGPMPTTYLPSRRPSVRHQKMLPGPDAQPLLPLLLDPLRPISQLTWSDLRSRSPSTGSSASPGDDSDHRRAMSAEDDPDALADAMDAASLETGTNRATTSHRSTSSRSGRDREREYSTRGEFARPVITHRASGTGAGAAAAGTATRPGLALPPSPHRSPTPPGLPSKREYSILAARRASLPLPITPTSPASSASDSSHHHHHRYHQQQSGAITATMPLFSPAPSSSASAGSALASHPSARARSGTHKPGMEPVLEDSAADAYADSRSLQLPSPPASPEQQQPGWRGASSSSSTGATSAGLTRRRPSLTATQSAPAYRPRSSTGPAIPLTAAFQTSVLRSGSGLGAQAGASGHRYPPIVTSAPQGSRTRPSSVSVTTGGLLSPESPEMSRPTEAFRRMSTTDIRHRRPSTAQGLEERERSENPRGEEGLARARGVSMSAGRSEGPSFTIPPPNPLSPPELAPTPPRLSVHTRALGGGPPNVTWRGSPALPATTQQQQYQQQQYQQAQAQGGPALVRRRDSPALRPIPVSALMPGAAGGSRSRSNSVRSTRSTMTGAGTMQLPPLDPVTPLTMSLRSSPEDEETEAGPRR